MITKDAPVTRGIPGVSGAQEQGQRPDIFYNTPWRNISKTLLKVHVLVVQ